MMMRNSKTHATDFHVRDAGTVFGFTPLTTAAKDWLDQNVKVASWPWLSKTTMVVDSTYADMLLRSIFDSGLSVH